MAKHFTAEFKLEAAKLVVDHGAIPVVACHYQLRAGAGYPPESANHKVCWRGCLPCVKAVDILPDLKDGDSYSVQTGV